MVLYYDLLHTCAFVINIMYRYNMCSMCSIRGTMYIQINMNVVTFQCIDRLFVPTTCIVYVSSDIWNILDIFDRDHGQVL